MDIRERAIEDHHKTAGLFEELYAGMKRDYCYSSFSYGRKKMDELFDEILAGIPAGGKLLDVGCGTGEQVKRFRDKGFQVTGVEPADDMRVKAQERNPDAVIVKGVATELPFGDGEFDAVICIEVLRYLDHADNMQAYREMLRVTKPGGRIIVSLVNRWALDGFYVFDKFFHVLSRITGTEPPIHCEYVTPWQVRRELEKMTDSKITFYGRMTGPLRIIYKVCRPLGAWCARRLEKLDDWISKQRWSVPFAGHLILVIER